MSVCEHQKLIQNGIQQPLHIYFFFFSQNVGKYPKPWVGCHSASVTSGGIEKFCAGDRSIRVVGSTISSEWKARLPVGHKQGREDKQVTRGQEVTQAIRSKRQQRAAASDTQLARATPGKRKPQRQTRVAGRCNDHLTTGNRREDLAVKPSDGQ